jgi:5-methylcytosine-specific restriction endonuclease McrA
MFEIENPRVRAGKRKKELRNQLYERDGTKCHYCGIEEKDFPTVWGKTFYGGIKRGRILEIDHIDNSLGDDVANCVLACALCNMAKSDKFTYEEFKKVGDVIKEIWQQRKSKLSQSNPDNETIASFENCRHPFLEG